MSRLCVLALAGMCKLALAQTPAANPMPDGSRDMYLGLGAQWAPRYDGASGHRATALPVLQFQWSNGVFVSGMSAGMHLSQQPWLEYGPLLALAPGRSASGYHQFRFGSVSDGSGNPIDTLPPRRSSGPALDEGYEASYEENPTTANRLEGMFAIRPRVVGGGFLNVYLSPQWRATGKLLYGAGKERRGLMAHLALQRLALEPAPNHTLAMSAGVTLVNRAYSATYFGVQQEEADQSINAVHAPGGGLQDVRAGLRWNWCFSPSWMLTSGVQAIRFVGDAKNSPLVERPTNFTVSTALAYRF
jgi:outer membrane scaffolding protein for murein synthesis (MipA/OmpV family)